MKYDVNIKSTETYHNYPVTATQQESNILSLALANVMPASQSVGDNKNNVNGFI